MRLHVRGIDTEENTGRGHRHKSVSSARRHEPGQIQPAHPLSSSLLLPLVPPHSHPMEPSSSLRGPRRVAEVLRAWQAPCLVYRCTPVSWSAPVKLSTQTSRCWRVTYKVLSVLFLIPLLSNCGLTCNYNWQLTISLLSCPVFFLPSHSLWVALRKRIKSCWFACYSLRPLHGVSFLDWEVDVQTWFCWNTSMPFLQSFYFVPFDNSMYHKYRFWIWSYYRRIFIDYINTLQNITSVQNITSKSVDLDLVSVVTVYHIIMSTKRVQTRTLV